MANLLTYHAQVIEPNGGSPLQNLVAELFARHGGDFDKIIFWCGTLDKFSREITARQLRHEIDRSPKMPALEDVVKKIVDIEWREFLKLYHDTRNNHLKKTMRHPDGEETPAVVRTAKREMGWRDNNWTGDNQSYNESELRKIFEAIKCGQIAVIEDEPETPTRRDTESVHVGGSIRGLLGGKTAADLIAEYKRNRDAGAYGTHEDRMRRRNIIPGLT